MHTSVLLIGSGRLAKHIRHWHSLLNLPYNLTVWARHEPIETLQEHLRTHQLVWLAISDTALVYFFETHLQSFNLKVVHFSGALHDDRMLSAHPLMSFSNELYDLAIYNKIHFSLTSALHISEVLPDFKNTFGIIKADEKALYHALCVMTGNFPQMLWSKTFEMFKSLKVPDQAVDEYIEQITRNFIQLKNKAVTGPIQRQDLITIKKNLSALDTQPILKNIYTTFAEGFKS